MTKHLRCLLTLLCLVLTACAASNVAAQESIVFTLEPAAPTPDDRVVIGFFRHPPTRLPAPIGALDLYRLGSPIGEVQHIFAKPVIGSNGLAADIGKLALGRYEVEYYEAQVPGYEDSPAGSFQFSVTSTGPVEVVEFFNAALGHYFITADPDEIELIDLGYRRGWVRTGLGFHALDAATMPSNALPVCRFYGAPEAGLDSHFFSQDAAECDAVAKRWPGIWNLETDRAFALEDWSWRDYFCELPEHAPLFRLYNNRPDANHRYTTSVDVRDAMIAQGWILEARFPGDDYRVDLISACVLR